MAEKTEKPTHKKLLDGSKKGQILKSRDAIISLILFVGSLYLYFAFTFSEITDHIKNIINHGFDYSLEVYVRTVFFSFFIKIFSFISLISLFICIYSLLQSKFALATKALNLNFSAINPVTGFKRIFNLRTVKEFIKTLLYIVIFSMVIITFWKNKREILFSTIHQDVGNILKIWSYLLFQAALYCIIPLILVIILDFLAEYFLFMKDMKMDKQEVKREYIEQEGNPEMKYHRKQMHHEILSEQLKSDIDNSKLIISNPTHIVIGIYFKPNICPAPLISIRETDAVALSIRHYAEKNNIPVITDIPLARKLFATHKRYDYVALEQLDKILNLLFWLEDVENMNKPIEDEDLSIEKHCESQDEK